MTRFSAMLLTSLVTVIFFIHSSWAAFAILSTVIIAFSILLWFSVSYFDNGVATHLFHDPYIGGTYAYVSGINLIASATQCLLYLREGIFDTIDVLWAGGDALPFLTIGMFLAAALLAVVLRYNFLQAQFAVDSFDNAKACSIQKL